MDSTRWDTIKNAIKTLVRCIRGVICHKLGILPLQSRYWVRACHSGGMPGSSWVEWKLWVWKTLNLPCFWGILGRMATCQVDWTKSGLTARLCRLAPLKFEWEVRLNCHLAGWKLCAINPTLSQSAPLTVTVPVISWFMIDDESKWLPFTW